MLSYPAFSPNNEVDDIRSLSSSSASFEYSSESLYPHSHLNQPQFNHFIMTENQPQSPHIVCPPFDWNMYDKSPFYPRNDGLYPSNSSVTHFPDLQSPTTIYWPKQQLVSEPDNHDTEYLRLKSYSPPTYISPSITHKNHPRVKSAAARIMHTEENRPKVMYQQFFSPPLLSNTLVLANESPKLGSPFEQALTNEKKFLYNIVLSAPTAIAKKSNEEPITYLNRGQAYILNFEPTNTTDTVTSSVSIAFHEPAHREIAKNYWKYWISQQESPVTARALDLDLRQTTGVFNVRLASFDRIVFDWHSQFGAKLCIHFNCLSTDFSRIKGVKGIPMRIVVETTQQCLQDPSASLKGTLKRLPVSGDIYEYKESCFCKIKLFRDKGAERKNKDDKKQKQKQIDKIIADTNGSPENHPLWSVMSQESKSTSSLSLVPTSPDITIEDLGELSDILLVPNNILPPITSKRKRSIDFPKTITKRKKVALLTFYVWSRHFNENPKEVLLNTFTTHHLKSKLASFLTVHPSRVSEVVWRRKPSIDEDHPNAILVLVEDSFISEHITGGEVMTVDWELKTDGSLRIILEF